MAWPTAPVNTTGMDQDTDALPRSDILDLTTKFNSLIAMLAVANGACELDASALVPAARIPASIARLASPVLVGAPTAPTPVAGDSSLAIATTAFVAGASVTNSTKWAGANKTVSTAAPTGGVDGDIWIVRAI